MLMYVERSSMNTIAVAPNVEVQGSRHRSGTGSDAATEFSRSRHRCRLWSSVQTLPREQRAVVVLRYYEELSEAETADLLGVSVGAVESQASRALAALRERAPPSLNPNAQPRGGTMNTSEERDLIRTLHDQADRLRAAQVGADGVTGRGEDDRTPSTAVASAGVLAAAAILVPAASLLGGLWPKGSEMARATQTARYVSHPQTPTPPRLADGEIRRS